VLVERRAVCWGEEALAIDCESESTRIEEFIRKQEKALGCSGAVLGLSGGLDSAVVATLAARALGPESVVGLIMPDRVSAPESKRDAVALAQRLGIRWEVHKITPLLRRVGTYGLYSPLLRLLPRPMLEKLVCARERELADSNGEPPFLASLSGGGPPELARGKAYCNSKHRARMVLIYFQAEKLNALALGCSNYTEHATGFFVQHGDDTGDIAPLQHLYKTQIFHLAEHLGVPRVIMDKPPSPDLVPGITDEAALGIPYSQLDVVLVGLAAELTQEEIASATGVDDDAVENVRLMRERSERKRNGPVCVGNSSLGMQ